MALRVPCLLVFKSASGVCLPVVGAAASVVVFRWALLVLVGAVMLNGCGRPRGFGGAGAPSSRV